MVSNCFFSEIDILHICVQMILLPEAIASHLTPVQFNFSRDFGLPL